MVLDNWNYEARRLTPAQTGRSLLRFGVGVEFSTVPQSSGEGYGPVNLRYLPDKEGGDRSAMSDSGGPKQLPTAGVHRRRRIPLVWIVPLITALIAAWLAWDTFSKRGPTIVISSILPPASPPANPSSNTRTW